MSVPSSVSLSVSLCRTRSPARCLSLLEMMATGLPVVVSDIPELQAIITDDVDGLVVPLDDVEALTRALTSLIEDRARRERLGAAARAGIERHHREDPIQALEAFYRSVAP